MTLYLLRIYFAQGLHSNFRLWWGLFGIARHCFAEHLNLASSHWRTVQTFHFRNELLHIKIQWVLNTAALVVNRNLHLFTKHTCTNGSYTNGHWKLVPQEAYLLNISKMHKYVSTSWPIHVTCLKNTCQPVTWVMKWLIRLRLLVACGWCVKSAALKTIFYTPF